ncbi:MAG: zinc dependent phospholipase C family protein [Parafilimonas sp.]
MRKGFNNVLLFSSCFVIIISLCSWGFYVHETATQLAIYQLPKQLRKFFFSNIDSLTINAIRPDKRRYTDKTEGPKHFIDLENYGADAINTMPHDWQIAVAKYSLDTLKRYGYVPYQVLIEYDSLIHAFKQKNTDSIILYADDMAHYIEDANVPLHTTNNYDGQLTNQKGIHALWESAIPELELSNYNLHSKHKAIYIKNKSAAVWNAVQRAHALLPELFEKEKEVSKKFPDSSKYIEKRYYGKKTKVYTKAFAIQYAAALGSTINNQLINSANMVADFWYSAWIDAGKPNLKSLYHFNKKDRKKLYREMKAYKKNKLVKDSLIRANKE